MYLYYSSADQKTPTYYVVKLELLLFILEQSAIA